MIPKHVGGRTEGFFHLQVFIALILALDHSEWLFVQLHF